MTSRSQPSTGPGRSTARPAPGSLAAASTGREPRVDRWVLLLRGVAGGLIVTFAFLMFVVTGALVAPLAVATAAFGVPLALSFRYRRGSAAAIGILATLWLGSQVANAPLVLPDLANPAAGSTFVTTVAMIVLPVAGVVGFVGLLRRAPEVAATRTWRAAGAIIGLAILWGATASILGDEVASEGRTTVPVHRVELRPAHLRVVEPATVTVAGDAALAGVG